MFKKRIFSNDTETTFLLKNIRRRFVETANVRSFLVTHLQMSARLLSIK